MIIKGFQKLVELIILCEIVNSRDSLGRDKKLIEEHQWDMLETKQEARHEGILKIFELIKENK